MRSLQSLLSENSVTEVRKKSFFLKENTEGDVLSLNRNSCSEEKSFLLPLIQDGKFWLKGKLEKWQSGNSPPGQRRCW